MPEALINPEIISWARSRAGVDRDRFAKDVKASRPQVESWEEGSSRPSLATAMSIAKTLKIPFGYLFLSEPPADAPVIPDFRSNALSAKQHFSADLRDVLNAAVLKQQWFESYLEQTEQVQPQQRTKLTSNDADVANAVREQIGWSDETRRANSTPAKYLSELVKKAEAAGIVVLRSGVVGSNNRRALAVSEFRGFALSAGIAPLIFINANDAKSAQVFTFAHELAHVWLGVSGVSDSQEPAPKETGLSIEQRCNGIAAELVAPRVLFSEVWKRKNDSRLVAAHFRVSQAVILRRAFDTGFLTADQFQNALEAIPKHSAKKGKGGNFRTVLYARNSTMFTTALLNQVKRGTTSYREAGRLLSIKPSTVSKLNQPKRASE